MLAITFFPFSLFFYLFLFLFSLLAKAGLTFSWPIHSLFCFLGPAPNLGPFPPWLTSPERHPRPSIVSLSHTCLRPPHATPHLLSYLELCHDDVPPAVPHVIPITAPSQELVANPSPRSRSASLRAPAPLPRRHRINCRHPIVRLTLPPVLPSLSCLYKASTALTTPCHSPPLSSLHRAQGARAQRDPFWVTRAAEVVSLRRCLAELLPSLCAS